MGTSHGGTLILCLNCTTICTLTSRYKDCLPLSPTAVTKHLQVSHKRKTQQAQKQCLSLIRMSDSSKPTTQPPRYYHLPLRRDLSSIHLHTRIFFMNILHLLPTDSVSSCCPWYVSGVVIHACIVDIDIPRHLSSCIRCPKWIWRDFMSCSPWSSKPCFSSQRLLRLPHARRILMLLPLRRYHLLVQSHPAFRPSTHWEWVYTQHQKPLTGMPPF